jgi:ATP-dependent Clp protease ATP-binding subunit ClpA
MTPLEALERTSELRKAIADFERYQVACALADGEPMSAIARALGVSRQAAHRRFRHLAESQQTVTADARLVVEYACREAAALGTPVGVEHLLVGILRHGDDRAAAALETAGLTLETARAHLGTAAGQRTDPRLMLDDAVRHALRRDEPSVGVMDLLAACLRDPGGAAAAFLEQLDVAPAAVAQALDGRVPALGKLRPARTTAGPRAAAAG